MVKEQNLLGSKLITLVANFVVMVARCPRHYPKNLGKEHSRVIEKLMLHFKLLHQHSFF